MWSSSGILNMNVWRVKWSGRRDSAFIEGSTEGVFGIFVSFGKLTEVPTRKSRMRRMHFQTERLCSGTVRFAVLNTIQRFAG